MLSRDELQERAEEVRKRMDHQARRPVGRAAATPVPGTSYYTSEFIFGAVWARPGLSLRDRMMGSLALLTALERPSQLRSYAYSALNLDIKPEEIQEVLVQCSPFTGHPAVMNALEVVQEIFRERGVTPADFEVPRVPMEELEARGLALYEKLFGSLDANPRLQVAAKLAPDLRQMLIAYVFGELYHRPVLDIKTRVLCTIAALTAMRLDPPLGLFLGAGLRVGYTRDEVIEVIIQMAPYAGFPAALDALQVAERHLDGAR